MPAKGFGGNDGSTFAEVSSIAGAEVGAEVGAAENWALAANFGAAGRRISFGLTREVSEMLTVPFFFFSQL